MVLRLPLPWENGINVVKTMPENHTPVITINMVVKTIPKWWFIIVLATGLTTFLEKRQRFMSLLLADA